MSQFKRKCVYCHSSSDLSDEHAPPKSIFKRPWPDDLITVRACQSCNRSASKDIEYFRLWISIHPQLRDNPAIEHLAPIIRRSFERSEAEGFLRSFISSFTPMGGDEFFFRSDMERIFRTVNRTVRCLYAKHFDRLLPINHGISSLSVESLPHLSQEKLIELGQMIECSGLMECKPIHSANGSFSYRIAMFSDTAGMCMTSFFEAMTFVSFLATPRSPIHGDTAR